MRHGRTDTASSSFQKRVAACKPNVPPRGDGTNKASLLFPNGSRIVALPGTEKTVRGFSKVSLLMIDEAARVGKKPLPAFLPVSSIVAILNKLAADGGALAGRWPYPGDEDVHRRGSCMALSAMMFFCTSVAPAPMDV